MKPWHWFLKYCHWPLARLSIIFSKWEKSNAYEVCGWPLFYSWLVICNFRWFWSCVALSRQQTKTFSNTWTGSEASYPLGKQRWVSFWEGAKTNVTQSILSLSCKMWLFNCCTCFVAVRWCRGGIIWIKLCGAGWISAERPKWKGELLPGSFLHLQLK